MFVVWKTRLWRSWSELLLTDAVPRPSFANHESFHLRYGWLKKAYDAISADPRAFGAPDALIKLGVGKNMIRSIRFWSLACKIAEQPTSKPDMYPSALGTAIFDDKNGLDPYLEDPQTLWLLHWMLFAPPCKIPVWWIAMNEFSATNVRVADLGESIWQKIIGTPEWKTPNAKSVKKDMDVFIRTYTSDRGSLAIEDYLDCPFRQLGMIRQSSRDMMRFVYGLKEGMTPEIVTFACLDFAKQMEITSKSISVTRLATEAGSVGHAFKIDEHDLGAMLTEALKGTKNAHVEIINGALHLVFDDLQSARDEILANAYNMPRFSITKKKQEVILVN